MGNFYIRHATDIEIAGMDNRNCLISIVRYDDKLDDKLDCYFQCALLYTTIDGHRLIRIHNLSLPVTSVLSQIFRHAEMDSIVNMIFKAGKFVYKVLRNIVFIINIIAVAKLLSTSKTILRDQLTDQCAKILMAYRKNCATSSSSGQVKQKKIFFSYKRYFTYSFLLAYFTRILKITSFVYRLFIKKYGISTWKDKINR
jgi:protein transport protein SEC24